MSTLTPSPTVSKHFDPGFNLWDNCQESRSDSYNEDTSLSRPNPVEEAKEIDEADYISALGFNYGPTLTAFISDGNLRNLYSLKRHSEESPSLFRNEVNAPVSIIICPAPNDNQSTYRSSPASSTSSIPTISTDDLPNATHLMPPSEKLHPGSLASAVESLPTDVQKKLDELEGKPLGMIVVRDDRALGR